MTGLRHLIQRLGILFVMLSGVAACAAPEEQAELDGTTIYLVRHAEKVLDVSNPPLTEDGQARAALLAEHSALSKISRIHSTDYVRTRQTAAPIAEALDIDVEIYDPSDLTGFAAQLIEQGGESLVVGHSNTTPQLVEALGGEPGTEIDEAAEYDRLYIVEINADGNVASEIKRYGVLYEPDL